jgi:hypothetical protein
LTLSPVLCFCQTAKDFALSGVGKSKNKDSEGAIQDYNKSLELDPTNANVYSY